MDYHRTTVLLVLLSTLAVLGRAFTVTRQPAPVAARRFTEPRLNCTVESDSTAISYSLTWNGAFYDPTLTPGVIYAGNDNQGSFKDNFATYFTNDAESLHDIQFKNTFDYGWAGKYTCGLLDVLNPTNTAAYATEVVVLDELKCPEPQVQQEGATPAMICSIDYAGNLDPIMEWWVDGKMVEGFAQMPADEPAAPPAPKHIDWVYNFTVTPEHNNAEFLCVLHFGDAVDTPDYSVNCTTSLSVIHGVTNVKISPDPDNFDQGIILIDSGDQLNCTASGNPDPKYYWTQVEGNSDAAIQEGPFLETSDVMLGPNKYTCTAYNDPNGQREESVVEVNFYVVEVNSGSRLITTFSSVILAISVYLLLN